MQKALNADEGSKSNERLREFVADRNALVEREMAAKRTAEREWVSGAKRRKQRRAAAGMLGRRPFGS